MRSNTIMQNYTASSIRTHQQASQPFVFGASVFLTEIDSACAERPQTWKPTQPGWFWCSACVEWRKRWKHAQIGLGMCGGRWNTKTTAQVGWFSCLGVAWRQTRKRWHWKTAPGTHSRRVVFALAIWPVGSSQIKSVISTNRNVILNHVPWVNHTHP